MINLKQYKGFCLLKGDYSIEAKKLGLFCTLGKIPLIRVEKNITCPIDYVPCGSVEWCLFSLGKTLIPDYYPLWLSQYLYRKVWKEDKWPLGQKVFIKPSDVYKRFTGFETTGTYKKKKKGPFWCSEIVKFENEWRYYITNGKVICGEWYWGDEVNTPKAPDISHIHIPNEFCGTIDFGMMKVNGIIPYKFTLVEVHHPFACGWYGDKTELYAQWLIDGWGSLLEGK